MLAANVPKRYWQTVWSTIPAVKKAHERLSASDTHRPIQLCEDGLGLIIYGPLGSGKTMAAVQIMKAVIARGATALFVPACEAVSLFRGDMRLFDGSPAIDRFNRSQLVVLDDLGLEDYGKVTTVSRSAIERMLRDSYHQARGLVITTNMPPKQLCITYGDVVGSLIERVYGNIQIGGE
jgi:DNA replication protein DnaC